jgi:hypothetical protein
MTATKEVLGVFARSILAKVQALKLELTKTQRMRLRRSITEDIRTCGGLIYPDMKSPEVSKAAAREAKRRKVDLCKMNWHKQPAFDPGRKMFQWEHVCTVRSIQARCETAQSEDAVLQILNSCLRIAWILKREDKELTRLGYGNVRDDPDAAYSEAKIELLK